MFKQKFGFIPKKTVIFDGETIWIGKHKILVTDIHSVFVRPYDFANNEWGSIYFSLNGEDYNQYDSKLKKNSIKFTKGQTKKIDELLSQLRLDIHRKGLSENEKRAFFFKRSQTWRRLIMKIK